RGERLGELVRLDGLVTHTLGAQQNAGNLVGGENSRIPELVDTFVQRQSFPRGVARPVNVSGPCARLGQPREQNDFEPHVLASGGSQPALCRSQRVPERPGFRARPSQVHGREGDPERTTALLGYLSGARGVAASASWIAVQDPRLAPKH